MVVDGISSVRIWCLHLSGLGFGYSFRCFRIFRALDAFRHPVNQDASNGVLCVCVCACVCVCVCFCARTGGHFYSWFPARDILN